MAIAPGAWRDLLARLCVLRLGLYLAALDKVDLGIEDNHVAFLDAIAYFHLRPQIPCHGYFSDVGVTTVDYGELQAVAIENDRLGGHQKARCVMRNMKLDPTVGPGLIAPSGFGMSISVSSVRVPGSSVWQYARHFAGESATGQL